MSLVEKYTQTFEAISSEQDIEKLATAEYAQALDAADELFSLRQKFNIPPMDPKNPESSGECTYLCGNSLGVQPKKAEELVTQHMKDWKNLGVVGHFDEENSLGPWTMVERKSNLLAAEILGAKEDEVCVCNTLSVNLHLLLVSFYRPNGKRNKIVLEADSFCSDSHVVRSQVELHGLDPDECILRITPREGETLVRMDDAVEFLYKHKDEIAVLLIPGIQYYTGQVWDIPRLTKVGHEIGAVVGCDLAHSMCNVQVKLHDWDVDFAVWCHYKYGNAGPGAIAGLFLHEKHFGVKRPQLQGWWGQTVAQRFQMKAVWQGEPGARGYQISNPPVISILCVEAGLQEYISADPSTLRYRSKCLTKYLERMLDIVLPNCVQLTPRNADERGCQISIRIPDGIDIHELSTQLAKNGVIVDERKPNVIRIAPTPLYNNYQDVHRAVHVLKSLL